MCWSISILWEFTEVSIFRFIVFRQSALQFVLAKCVNLEQWFSTFLVERNPNETFQRLEEPLCGNLIVLCQGGPTSALLWATFQNYSSFRAVTG